MASPRIYQVANLQTELTTTADSANNRVLRAGDTMTGELNVANNLVVTGNVGVGTSNPVIFGGGIEISRESQAGLRVSATGSGTPTGIEIGADTNGKGYIQTVTANAGIQFYTGNASNIVMTMLGDNVGIGTTNPSGPLHVYGNSNTSIPFYFTNANSGTTARSRVVIEADSSAGSLSLGMHSSAHSVATNEAWVWASGASTPLILGTVGSERMRISTTGDVNIGVTGFTERLVISAPGTSNNVTFWMLGTNGAGGQSNGVKLKALGAATSTGAGTFTIETRSTDLSYYERFRITSEGNIGIGTTSPNQKLHVWLDNGEFAHFGSTNVNANTEYAGISLGYTEAAGYRKTAIVQQQIGDGAARGHLHFLVDINADGNSVDLGDSKMMIHGISGYVGIGTTNPQQPFVLVDATTRGIEMGPSGGVGSGAFIQGYTRATNVYNPFTYYATQHTFYSGTGGSITRIVDISTDGRVGIGTSSPRSKLDVRGGIEVNPTNTSGNDQSPTVFGFYHFYRTNAGADYAHLKTNIPAGGSQGYYGMILIEATGYVYGTAQTIKSMWGFHNWSGGIYSGTVQNLGQRAFANTLYVSSDGFVVLTCLVSNGSFYTGARFDFIDIQADYAIHYNHPPQVTAVSYTNSTTGAF